MTHLLHLLVHLLPDAGHPEEDGRERLLQRLRQSPLQRVLVGEVNGALNVDHGEYVADVGGHVAEGEVRNEPLLPVLQVEGVAEPPGGVGQVVVAEHHALGEARGAGGVHEVAALVDGDVPQALVQGLVALLPVKKNY